MIFIAELVDKTQLAVMMHAAT
ncbi:MAG: TMEM165/GDT1 family protein [Anaerolineae bacterium]|nr:TMEM165/GDT1 family protein [Anaerolineae bacterium]